MPNWISTADKTGQGLISGIPFGGGETGKYKYGYGGKRSVSASLKKSLDSTGAGLLQGISLKKGTGFNTTRLHTSTWRDDPYKPTTIPSHIQPGTSRPHISAVATTMVHDIPCFDLPPLPTSESNYAEASLWDRIKWNKSLKENKHMEISLPINLLTFEETQQKRDSAYDEIAKYVDIGYVSTEKPALRVEVTNLKRQHTVRDASPTITANSRVNGFEWRRSTSPASYVYCRFCPCEVNVNGQLCGHLERCGCGNIQFTRRGIVAAKMTKPVPTDSDFAYCCPSSTLSATPTPLDSASNTTFPASELTNETEMPPSRSPSSSRRVQYPSMKKIPEDLPCHERYTALSRSRSTRALVKQKVWTADAGAGYEGAEPHHGQQCSSDASSVYSQDERQEHSGEI